MKGEQVETVLEQTAQNLIESFKEEFYERFMEKYNLFPDEWICNQDIVIRHISERPLKECLAITILALNAGDFISQVNHDVHGKLFTYTYDYLIEVGNEKDYKQLADDCRCYGKTGFNLGFGLLFELASRRFQRYLDDNPTGRDTLYVRYPEEFAKDTETKPLLERAYSNLAKHARDKFENRLKKQARQGLLELETDLGRELWSYVFEASTKALPFSVEENIIAAADKDYKRTQFVPLMAYQVAADEEIPGYQAFRKQKERLRKQGKTDQEIKHLLESELNLMNPVPIEDHSHEGDERINQLERGYDVVEFSSREFDRNIIDNAITEYIDTLYPQAAKQREAGKFLHETNQLGKYIIEVEEKNPKLGNFRLDPKAISKDSGISLRTVESFCKRLTEFHSKKT